MTKYEIKEIPIEKVYANWFQPRKSFDKEKIKELAESILSNGLINPITVKAWRDGKYLIVSGERRWRAHKVAGIKEITAFVKEYKDDGQFMIDSLIENIHREDLSSMEKAIFIKKIWKQMGKPMNRQGEPDVSLIQAKIHMNEFVIREHLSLVDISTPQEVKKAVEKGKLAMRSASIISKLPEKKQVAIAKESMKRETGIGRQEVERYVKEAIPEPLQKEETANDVVDDILTNLHDFQYQTRKLLKEMNIEDLSKAKANKAITTCGLFLKSFKEFVNVLRQRGAIPDKSIMELIRANGKF